MHTPTPPMQRPSSQPLKALIMCPRLLHLLQHEVVELLPSVEIDMMSCLVDNDDLCRRIVLFSLLSALPCQHPLALLLDLLLRAIPACDVHPVVLAVHDDDGE